MDKAALREELERRGHGAQKALAEFLGRDPSIVSKMLTSARKISSEEAERIADWLARVPAEAPPPMAMAMATEVSPAQRRLAQPLAPLDLRRREMPVWAAVEGGDEGAMLITTAPVDWIPRPRELQVIDAFAVYLVGESMHPAYDHGDQLYIHPHLPPKGGDDCLFIRQVDETSFLGLAKRLLRQSSTRWRVRQFTPDKEFDLDRSVWTKAWKIVGKMNRT